MNSAFLWFRPLNQSLFSVKNMPDDSKPTQFLQLVNWLVPDGLITSLPNLVVCFPKLSPLFSDLFIEVVLSNYII